MRSCLLLATIACGLLACVLSCPPDQYQNGCKISGNSCTCGYGCRSENIYRTRRSCLNALRAATAPPSERSSNICHKSLCSRGLCIQTVNEPGFACKCEGTEYYGERCEKACPTGPIGGMVFPHECVVI